jgi:hypothetical protein
MLSSRTVVSSDYSVADLGLYSFANRLSQAIFMGLGTIGWILFSKILYKLRWQVANDEAKELVLLLRNSFVTLNFFTIFFIVLIFPFLIQFLEKYQNMSSTFVFIVFSQGIISNVFGFSDLAIARRKEVKLALYGFLTIALNVFIAIFFSRILKLHFSFIALGNLLSIVCYTIMVVKEGYTILGERKSILNIIGEIFPFNISIPLSIYLLGNFTNGNSLYFVGFFLFLVLNWRNLVEVIKNGKIIFLNQRIINRD